MTHDARDTFGCFSRGSKCTTHAAVSHETSAQAHVNFLGKQSSSCSDARKGQTCFPILMGKLILGPPWLSFLGGQRIPVSHIPSTHHAALIRDPVESGSSLSWSYYRVCCRAVRLAKMMNPCLRVAWHGGSLKLTQTLTWDGGCTKAGY